MECQNIINLPDTTSDNFPRFITKKWIEVHDQSVNAESRLKISMLQSDLCDYSHAYIVVKKTINVADPNKNMIRI